MSNWMRRRADLDVEVEALLLGHRDPLVGDDDLVGVAGMNARTCSLSRSMRRVGGFSPKSSVIGWRGRRTPVLGRHTSRCPPARDIAGIERPVGHRLFRRHGPH
jgi:hypothetical protein